MIEKVRMTYQALSKPIKPHGIVLHQYLKSKPEIQMRKLFIVRMRKLLKPVKRWKDESFQAALLIKSLPYLGLLNNGDCLRRNKLDHIFSCKLLI